MTLSDVVEACREKISWPNMRSILKDNNIVSAVGWEKTYEKINESYKKNELEDIVKKLWIAYKNHILYGNKMIRLLKTSKANSISILSSLATLIPPDSDYKKVYPLSLQSEELKNKSILPILVDVEINAEYMDLVFCAKRVYSEREKFDVNNLTESAKQLFKDFDDVIAIRKVVKQSFDIIRIRNDGYIEIRADLIDEIGAEDHVMFVGNLIDVLLSLIFNNSGIHKDEFAAVNFYKLLRKFYDEADGRIVEIGHDTGTTGGIVREKMRRKILDVRLENFHMAGMDAVEGISLFSLAKAWTMDNSVSEPELFFPGSIRVLSNKNQGTFEAIVRNCITSAHYELIIDKIKTYL